MRREWSWWCREEEVGFDVGIGWRWVPVEVVSCPC